MKYKHLTVEEREKIQEMLWQKQSIRAIATGLGRSPSSISREIRKNKSPERHRYTPRVAHERSIKKRSSRGQSKLMRSEVLRTYITTYLKLGWSPEQIAALSGNRISHETIYQYIYAQIHREGYGNLMSGKEDLRPYLARHRKRRVKKGQRKSHRILKGLLPSIDDRPREVELRTTVGHWEDDSMVYTPTSAVRLRTTNERVSGVVFITKTHNRTMADANRITQEHLSTLPSHLRKTLTRDRGSENLGYVELEDTLGIQCFFAHAYSSWERGSNENLNGLIRRFLPKGTDFSKVSDEEITQIEYLLNTRPRKRLGWKTPYTVFYELTGVALGV